MGISVHNGHVKERARKDEDCNQRLKQLEGLDSRRRTSQQQNTSTLACKDWISIYEPKYSRPLARLARSLLATSKSSHPGRDCKKLR